MNVHVQLVQNGVVGLYYSVIFQLTALEDLPEYRHLHVQLRFITR